MSKCVNCLSNEVCKWYANGNSKNLCCADNFPCPEYKDKSRFIELPCAVGDTVWFIFGNSCHNAKVGQIVIEPFEEIGYSVICYGGFGFDKRQFGKTVFLTPEQAEKALKEVKK